MNTSKICVHDERIPPGEKDHSKNPILLNVVFFFFHILVLVHRSISVHDTDGRDETYSFVPLAEYSYRLGDSARNTFTATDALGA